MQQPNIYSVNRNTIWDIRMERIQRVVLNDWNCFTIWNAGKQGRKFYRSLSQENKYKVLAFCDVDIQKIGRKYVPFNKIDRQVGCSIDIVHFKDAKRPFIICVKLVSKKEMIVLIKETKQSFIYFRK